MRNIYTNLLLLCGVAILVIGCQQKTDKIIDVPSQGISFSSSIVTKATDTAFESGDEIGVSAFSDAALTQIYADNVAYKFGSEGLFVASGNDVVAYPEDGASLAFRAIYPFTDGSYSDEFTFSVLADQSDYDSYTLSDLMTATTEATTEEVPALTFSHSLSRVVVQIASDVSMDGAVVKFLNVLKDASVDLTEGTFEGVGETGSVALYDNGDYSHKAILAPQSFEEGAEFVSVEFRGETYIATLETDAAILSGKQYFFPMELDLEAGVLTYSSDIIPWGYDDMYDDEDDVPTNSSITTTLADIPTDGSLGSGTWVITDSYASSDDFDGLRTAIYNAGGPVSLVFSKLKTLPDGLNSYYSGGSSQLDNLVSVTSSSIQAVLSYALSSCYNLSAIALPNATDIEEYAFYNLPNLKNLAICRWSSSASVSDNMFGDNYENYPALTVGKDEVTGGVSHLETLNYSWKPTSTSKEIKFKYIVNL